MGRGEDAQFVDLANHVSGERVDVVQRIDIIAEELHAHRQLLVGRDDVHRVALHTESAASEGDVVTGVLDIHQQAQEPIAFDLFVDLQDHRAVQVGLRGAEAVNAGDRGDNHDVPARQQRGGRRVTQALHVLINGRVLLDVRIRLRDIRLRLVVVVIGDEVFHRVVRQQATQLVGQLGGQGFIRRHDQGGALLLFDQPGGRRGLTRTGGAHQHHVALASVEALVQFFDRLRLVAGGFVIANDLELRIRAFDLPHGAELGVRQFGAFCCKGHAHQSTCRTGHHLPSCPPSAFTVTVLRLIT